MKRHKGPGPDNITAEQLKFLNEAKQLAILALINRWWITGVIDEELELAIIISNLKKRRYREHNQLPANCITLGFLQDMRGEYQAKTQLGD